MRRTSDRVLRTFLKEKLIDSNGIINTSKLKVTTMMGNNLNLDLTKVPKELKLILKS